MRAVMKVRTTSRRFHDLWTSPHGINITLEVKKAPKVKKMKIIKMKINVLESF